MENQRWLEREMYQMEQIRELDAEELQVEEVEDDSSDDDGPNSGGYGEASTSGDFTFISGLASLHTYLGEVEDTRHRLACLDGGAVLNIPLFCLEGVVLFPESILPLRVLQPNLVAAVERVMSQVDARYTIGIIRVYEDAGDRRIRVANVGTTAEILQYRRLDDGSLNVVTRGQQRFRLNRQWIDVEGAPCGEVQVIQEDLPLRTPRDAVGRLAPLRNLRAPPSHTSQAKHIAHGDEDDDSDALSEESFERELSLTERSLHQSAVVPRYGCDMIDVPTASDDEKLVCESESQLEKSNLSGSICSFYPEGDKRSENDCLERGKKLISGRQSRRGVGCKKDSVSMLREVPRAFWPNWVYHMHDSYCLAQKAADRWKQIMGLPSMDVHVTKPDCLSFCIASKIPVSESTRQELLDIDGASYRLRRVIELLENFDHVRCKSCQAVIGKRSDVLIMSSEGPLGAYVNQHGYVHELMTLHKANGLALIGGPVKEYSWFPGYAWTIAECVSCESQMGWLFTATTKKLKPRSFWGIRCAQIDDNMS
ncbi:hypothetical protein RHGRI_005283 [Rhododendron griersonianum]|uniref:Protein cereblon n=1 Tax=Rhododendron griersonianum TaxID=479676 RepID=A0AAV6LDV8_9ERIC|nr:hypothetical protein RHGRI_005283 [Rhododendron griersonianum]